MIRLTTIAAAWAAGPALAHDGAHLHPHGTEFPLAAVFAAGLCLYIAVRLIRR